MLGPVEHVRAFVEARAALGGPPAALEMSERIYRLTEVQPIPSIPGRARPATLDDRDLVIAWLEAFRLDAFGEADRVSVVADADRWLARRGRSLHLWQDGDVVSLAGTGGRTPNGIRIGPVYTPPDARRRGYASALVAAISQAALDAGRRSASCSPTRPTRPSNHIYQAIGYAPVRDVEAYTVRAVVSADETTPLAAMARDPSTRSPARSSRANRRWPMAIAVVVLIVFALVSSSQLAFFPPWVLAAIEGVLLLALLLGDPGRIDRQTPWLRRTTILLVAVLLISTLGSTVILMYNLITNTAVANEPIPLLVAGAKVWLGNNVAFAFLYWGFDGGGPAARAHGMPQYPDLAFPQQTSPDLAPPRLAPAVHRLPVRRVHDGQRVQPDRHDADGPVGQDRDGVAGADLVRDRRPDHRPRGQPVPVGRAAHARPTPSRNLALARPRSRHRTESLSVLRQGRPRATGSPSLTPGSASTRAHRLGGPIRRWIVVIPPGC